MQMRKVALIGAGAVGAYFIWGFDHTREIELTVVAAGPRKERLLKDGVTINGRVYRPVVKDPAGAGVQDLVLIATKHGGLAGALDLLPPMIGPDTQVLSLLNGVDSEEKVAAAIGAEHVLPGLMRIASRRTEQGVTFDPEATMGVYYGMPGSTGRGQQIVAAVTALFAQTPLRYHVCGDITTEIWIKYAANIANNLPQAVLGVPASLYTKSGHGRFLAQQLWSEAAAVAAARGVHLPKEVLIFPGTHTGARFSTLQDLDARRHTEIEMFAGELMHMAAAAGIPVPYCTYTYHAIKALEEKNDGLFEV